MNTRSTLNHLSTPTYAPLYIHNRGPCAFSASVSSRWTNSTVTSSHFLCQRIHSYCGVLGCSCKNCLMRSQAVFMMPQLMKAREQLTETPLQTLLILRPRSLQTFRKAVRMLMRAVPIELCIDTLITLIGQNSELMTAPIRAPARNSCMVWVRWCF